MKISMLTLSVALAASGVAIAATPFAGSWTMNAAKSNLAGDTMTYTKTAAGYHRSGGGPVAYDFAVDGKDYPTVGDQSVSWTKTGDRAWTVVFKSKGKVMSKAHRELSDDGMTMTSNYEEFRADGTTLHESDVYKRVSGTKGLAGKWKDVKVTAVPDRLVISAPSAGSYRIEYPVDKIIIVTKGDGVAVPVSGPTVPAGATAMFKAESPMRWRYARILNGKTMGMGVMTVSPNGRTLTDVSWATGAENEKATEVYDRN